MTNIKLKTAYFDCPSGISGNMILGALIDAGLSIEYLKKELNNIPVTRYSILVTEVKKHHLKASHVKIKLNQKENPRTLSEILDIINKSKLSPKIRKKSIAIFMKLAEAESKAHGEPISKVHFHEVGQTDAIIDIVGTIIGLEKLGIDEIYCSELPYSGIAPATAQLLKDVPVFSNRIKKELVTPTGAAIITSITKSFGDMPRLKVKSIGFGAGSYKLPTPNLLNIIIGELEFPTEKDAILQIETNIDDMNPKYYDQAIAKIMQAGALDASIYPIRMKKKRNAIKLEVLCKLEDKTKILNVIFTETTTIGVRVYLVKREILKREIKKDNKVSYLGNKIIRIKPEA